MGKITKHELDSNFIAELTSGKDPSNFNLLKSGKDTSGLFTIIELYRLDGTLYSKSTLSNPDINGNYQTQTEEMYSSDGVTVTKTTTYTLGYDSDGDMVSRTQV